MTAHATPHAPRRVNPRSCLSHVVALGLGVWLTLQWTQLNGYDGNERGGGYGCAPLPPSTAVSSMSSLLRQSAAAVSGAADGASANDAAADGGGDRRSASDPPPPAAEVKEESSSMPYLTPVLFLDSKPHTAADLHQFILEVWSRTTATATKAAAAAKAAGTSNATSAAAVRVAPLRIFYPEGSDVQAWLLAEVAPYPPAVVETERFPNVRTRRDAYLSSTFWRRLEGLSPKILLTQMDAVLCGNPTKSLLWFASRYDWVGAAWLWAKDPKSVHHRGGNGALSIRNPSMIARLLEERGEDEKIVNEDMWFVRKLNEWVGRGGDDGPKLAPFEVQMEFSVEEIVSPGDVTPVGMYSTMKTVDIRDRESILRRCPEARRLFEVLHEPRCVQVRCARNMTEDFFQFDKRRREGGQDGGGGFDECVETCDVGHVAWTSWPADGAVGGEVGAVDGR